MVIYGLSEVWKPIGSACMLFLLFSVPPMVGTTQVSNVILWKCLTQIPYQGSFMITFHLIAARKDFLLPAGHITCSVLFNTLSLREKEKT